MVIVRTLCRKGPNHEFHGVTLASDRILFTLKSIHSKDEGSKRAKPPSWVLGRGKEVAHIFQSHRFDYQLSALLDFPGFGCT